MSIPHFYCEHCGAEVGRNAKICTVCGRFFTSVKCPRCSYSGNPAQFKSGCPVCGYVAVGGFMELPDMGESSPGMIKPLPVWTYFLAILGLVLAVIILFAVAR